MDYLQKFQRFTIILHGIGNILYIYMWGGGGEQYIKENIYVLSHLFVHYLD